MTDQGNAVWVHQYTKLGYDRPTPGCVRYLPADELEGRIERLERLGGELADAAGIVLPSSDRYTGPEHLLRISIDAFRTALEQPRQEGTPDG